MELAADPQPGTNALDADQRLACDPSPLQDSPELGANDQPVRLDPRYCVGQWRQVERGGLRCGKIGNGCVIEQDEIVVRQCSFLRHQTVEQIDAWQQGAGGRGPKIRGQVAGVGNKPKFGARRCWREVEMRGHQTAQSLGWRVSEVRLRNNAATRPCQTPS